MAIEVKGQYYDERYLSSVSLDEALKKYSRKEYRGFSLENVKLAWRLANPTVEKPKRARK